MADALRIPLSPIQSSNLQALGYDAVRSILAVQFKGKGDIYHYAGVSAALMARFRLAESFGRFYTDEIKGQFAGQRMTGPCPKCGDTGWDGDTCTDCGCAAYAVPPMPAKHCVDWDVPKGRLQRALCGALVREKEQAAHVDQTTCAGCLAVLRERDAVIL